MPAHWTSRTDLPLLRQLGVTHVLNVATGVRDLFPAGADLSGAAAAGRAVAAAGERLPCAFDFIEAARGAGGLCLVHCNAGVSRSAALVTAYLMERQGLSFSEALQLVNETRRVRPNPGFQSQLIDFVADSCANSASDDPLSLPSRYP
ncbi:dual specificity protein phosphatase 19-like [Pollicipes pollicipes]|uniref:dual specificity protein phosphatase 19-like n=1 Tax=Pollicipes pollicipes TaxID=41117 RepID=UPI0018855289|nr:dual specificity protein phosphatase 19-like [Pollicipes pollicipes]